MDWRPPRLGVCIGDAGGWGKGRRRGWGRAVRRGRGGAGAGGGGAGLGAGRGATLGCGEGRGGRGRRAGPQLAHVQVKSFLPCASAFLRFRASCIFSVRTSTHQHTRVLT